MALFILETGQKLDQTAACPRCGRLETLSAETAWSYEGDFGELVHHLKSIQRSGSQLRALIDDVLDFSKLTTAKMALHITRFPVSEIFQELEESMSPLASVQGLELKITTPGPAPLISADRVKCIQMLQNLIGNAIKFSPQGGAVELTATHQGSDFLFSVKHAGVGISSEHQKNIFESLFQVEGTNTRKFGGTGLGLPITRHLAQLHGDRVWVESELGKGSTFDIRLPDFIKLTQVVGQG